MGSIQHEPEPGELVGYLVVHGDTVKHWTLIAGDETRATLLAAQLHGTKYPLVVGNYLDGMKTMDREG